MLHGSLTLKETQNACLKLLCQNTSLNLDVLKIFLEKCQLASINDKDFFEKSAFFYFVENPNASNEW